MAVAERLPVYKPPIPYNQIVQYENLLAGIIRWENGTITSDIAESDLEHTRGIMLDLEDIQRECPNITSEIDFKAAYPMAYIHDGGELYSGDLAHTHPNYDFLKPRIKKRERAGFRLLTRSIEDEDTKKLARELYKRVEQKSPADKEAQLVDFVDKAQAVRFGIENVYQGHKIVDTQKRVIHLDRTMNVLFKPGKALVNALKSPYAKIEALGLIKKLLEEFIKQGYSVEEIQPYINIVSSWLPSNSQH